MSGEKTETIRGLNDAFRTSMTGGRVVMTAGVDALASASRPWLSERWPPSRSSHRTTTRTASTISAPSISRARRSFGKSTTTTLQWSSARKTRPTGEDHPRADHHARKRVLAVSVPWNPADPIETWIALGHANPWIRRAWDPPLTRRSFSRCADDAVLKARLEHGNWCLGSAFYR